MPGKLTATRRFLVVLFATIGLEASAQPLVGKGAGLETGYADWLSRVLQHWSAVPFAGESASPVSLTCIATANDDRYVGMLQRATIRADILVVERILDDVAHYKDLFPDTVDVQVVPGSRDGDRFVAVWEQRVPVFLLPNVTYELAYLVNKSAPGHSVYRYRLRKGDQLTASDGMVVLDAIGPNTTQFTEYDFFNARWSLLPATLVWRKSLQGAFLSDAAIKLKAENPDWSYERIAAEAQRFFELQAPQIEQCIASRKSAGLRLDF